MTPEEIAKLPYRPCVGVMLINADGDAFVGQRLDTDHDAWQMPQGGVDKEETPRDAAFRDNASTRVDAAALLSPAAAADHWSAQVVTSTAVPLVTSPWHEHFCRHRRRRPRSASREPSMAIRRQGDCSLLYHTCQRWTASTQDRCALSQVLCGV